MSKISPKDATDLSLDFDMAATSVGQYLAKNYGKLQPAEIESLRSLRWTLFDLAEELTQRAIGVNLTKLEGGLPVIREAAATATKAVKKLKAVGTVISIVSVLIDLVMSVSTGNAGGIAKNVGSLAKLVDGEKKANAK